MIRVTQTFLDQTLWPEFQQFQTVLHEHFAAVTKRVIARAIGQDDAEVEVRHVRELEG